MMLRGKLGDGKRKAEPVGITIHYRGTLENPERVQDLQRELADIAKSMGWEYRLLDDDWTMPPKATLVHEGGTATIQGHLGLKGIALAPTGGGETLSFFFDADGRLRSIMDVVLQCEGREYPAPAWVFVKTQFGSADDHVWIVGLLKYLQKRYLPDLEVRDEGGFWETGDRAELEEKMRFLNEKMDQLANDLAAEPAGDLSGLSPEDVVARIEQILKRRGEKQ